MILITPSWVPLDKRHILANTNQGGGYSPARNLKKNMNEEEERIIISRRTRSAMTYRVYEDREGKLHMTIYNEDTIGTCILLSTGKILIK